MPRCVAYLIVTVLLVPFARAHTMTMTQVLVSFGQPDTVDVKIDIDLTLLLGSAERYYELATEPGVKQQEDISRLVPRVLDNLQLLVGQKRLQLSFKGFSAAKAQKSDYLDTSLSKLSTLLFVATLPPGTDPLKLVVPIGAQIDYPVAYTVQIPSAHVSVTRWLEDGMHESDLFAWAGKVPNAGMFAVRFDPDSLPWPKQLALYLRLGFRHIVPEGADHILFVLGLFFLGVTWRKLISQTSVFTIAHATTLFLSTYGIFSLPGRYVEPAIALSIAVIALENVFRPKLGPERLAIVFGFGLIHGLGFASSLSDVPFPRRDFLIALLGFNFGVDFGQLFVIGLAFLAVGWFRNKTWFRMRIAIPSSLAIAAVGLFWAGQRIVHYSIN
jgi:hydrogenase/urease accessory protein HupE